MKISIIVPVYNVEKELSRCIDSLVKQTYKDIEIILVDDGSTDESPYICENYKKIYSNIKVIHKENGGLSSARNCGINNSSGEYLLFVDSDDYINNETCERFFKAIEKDDVDIVVGEARETRNNEIILYKHDSFQDNKVYSNTEYINIAIKNNEFYAPVCFNMYKKEFLLNNNLFFKEGILHEDMQYLPRVFLSAKKIKKISYIFYEYIIRENSITNNNNYKKNIEDIFEIYSEWYEMFKKIENKKNRKMLNCVLSKYFIASCRILYIYQDVYPKNIDKKFLICNTLNCKELVKTIFFLFSRKLYVEVKNDRIRKRKE